MKFFIILLFVVSLTSLPDNLQAQENYLIDCNIRVGGFYPHDQEKITRFTIKRMDVFSRVLVFDRHLEEVEQIGTELMKQSPFFIIVSKSEKSDYITYKFPKKPGVIETIAMQLDGMDDARRIGPITLSGGSDGVMTRFKSVDESYQLLGSQIAFSCSKTK